VVAVLVKLDTINQVHVHQARVEIENTTETVLEMFLVKVVGLLAVAVADRGALHLVVVVAVAGGVAALEIRLQEMELVLVLAALVQPLLVKMV
jgi:hypothetical protein